MKILKILIRLIQNNYNEIKNLKNNFYRNKANSIVGNLYLESSNKIKSKKYIICDAMWDSPHHWLRLAIFLPVLTKFYESNVMGIYLKDTNRKIIKTFKSFKFDYYKELDYSPKKKHYQIAHSLFNKLKKPDDIFDLDIPYGFPGSFLYDSILKTEMIGTIQLNNPKNIKHFAQLLSFLDLYDNVVDPKKVSAVVLSHPVNFRFASIVHITLMKKIPVYIINYINEYITIRKLENIQDWSEGSNEKPSIGEINSLSYEKRDHLEKIGENYIKKIRSSEKGQISTIGIFDSEAENNFNRHEFFQRLGLDPKKLTAIVMTGCWPDFPNIYPKTFYFDYVDWFLKTLEIITTISDVNWIIKPHPAEFMYGSKTKSQKLLKKFKNKNKNIRLWPRDVSTNCLLSIADVLITSHGSAGFEYPSLGKPVIVTKKTNYTDWGFSNSCLNYDNYKKLLHNLQSVRKPSEKSQKLAKIFIASHICNASNTSNKYLFEMGVLSNKLWPQIRKFVSINEENIYRERKMMNKWLYSKSQSYNFYKSINYDVWDD